MFNKNNESKFAEIEQIIKSLNNRIDDMDFLLRESGIRWVDNYFKDCPCCQGEPQKIFLSKAKSFKKIELCGRYRDWKTHYTTENSYRLHGKKIKEWEAEII